jgi:hypothetical protein
MVPFVPFSALFQNTRDSSNHALHILVRRLPVAHADAHRTAAAPRCAAKECFSRLQYLSYDFIRTSIVIFRRSARPLI